MSFLFPARRNSNLEHIKEVTDQQIEEAKKLVAEAAETRLGLVERANGALLRLKGVKDAGEQESKL